MQFDHAHISKLANRLINGISAKLENVVRNGDPNNWYPGKKFENFCILIFYRLRQFVICIC